MIAKSIKGRNTKGRIESIRTIGVSDPITLEFQFNPTKIQETRAVKYNFSEAQGQVLPLAQFGMIEPTTLSFDLFFHADRRVDDIGLFEEQVKLRSIMLPRKVSRLTYYEQAQPHKYKLYLGGYGVFIGVVNSLDFSTVEYHKTSLVPISMTATIEFTVVSSSYAEDTSLLKDMTGRAR